MLIFTATHFFCAMFLLHVFIALLLVVMIMPTMSVAFCIFGCGPKSPSDQIQAAIEGCPLQCGRGTGLSSKKETFFRVMGGDPVEKVDWPWTFLLETTDAACPGETYTCTATLYSNKFLLTAGHCLFKNVYACKTHPSGKAKIINVAYQPSELRVIRKGEAYSVRNVWVTPDFDENSAIKERFVGDLGIIEIDTEVAFEPLCWSSTLRRESTPVAHLVGWGAHEVDANGRAIGGRELRHAEVALASVQNCRDAWSQRAALCAGSGRSGALEGDSGSALIVRKFGLHFGIGLLSSYWQGMDRDQKADVYVPVSKYCAFIREVTGQECADANNVPIACVTSEGGGTRTDNVANV